MTADGPLTGIPKVLDGLVTTDCAPMWAVYRLSHRRKLNRFKSNYFCTTEIDANMSSPQQCHAQIQARLFTHRRQVNNTKLNTCLTLCFPVTMSPLKRLMTTQD